MHLRSVPAINTRYWVAITVASIFGANMGDFVSHNLHMGHIEGVPYIFAAFALIIVAARLSRGEWEGWYWLAIIALRTAATNLADLTIHDHKLGTLPVCAVLLIVMAATLLIRRTIAPDPVKAGVPRTDAGYWLAMLIAGTIGTGLGDGLAGLISLPVAALVSAVAVGLALGLRARPVLGLVAAYWLAIIAIRTFGTNFGDMLAHVLSLTVSTPLTGAAMLILLVVWRERRVALPATA
jgi:uncharacterized membrane-anchored protein